MSLFTKGAYHSRIADITKELRQRLNEADHIPMPPRPSMPQMDNPESEYDPRSAALDAPEYITNRTMAEQKVAEDPAKKAADVEASITQGTQAPTDPNAAQQPTDPNAMMDPNAMAAQPGMDPNAMAMGGGMPGMDPMGGLGGVPGEMTASQVGRVYELKKIYTRLVSLDNHLSSTSDVVLLRLRGFVSKALDLFHTMVSNIDAFIKEGKMDDIIVYYYEFIKAIYDILGKYYEITRTDQEKQ